MVYELMISYPLDEKHRKLAKKAIAVAKKHGFLEIESFTYLEAGLRRQRFESATFPDTRTIQFIERQMQFAIPKLRDFVIVQNERPLNQAVTWGIAKITLGGQVVAIQRSRGQPRPLDFAVEDRVTGEVVKVTAQEVGA